MSGRRARGRLAALAVPVLLAAALGAPAPAAAQAVLSGEARVLDGDTIAIGGRHVRLHGIDAPEGDQRCERDGAPHPCAEAATRALAGRIGRREVRCEARDIDRYGRVVAACWLGDENLNAWLVRNGYAIAYRLYSMDYVADEEAARRAGRGLWAGGLVLPEKLRRRLLER